jgi:hypothetical protein
MNQTKMMLVWIKLSTVLSWIKSHWLLLILFGIILPIVLSVSKKIRVKSVIRKVKIPKLKWVIALVAVAMLLYLYRSRKQIPMEPAANTVPSSTKTTPIATTHDNANSNVMVIDRNVIHFVKTVTEDHPARAVIIPTITEIIPSGPARYVWDNGDEFLDTATNGQHDVNHSLFLRIQGGEAMIYPYHKGDTLSRRYCNCSF